MLGRMRVLDTSTWKRRAQYDSFRGMAYPHFNVCADLDATVLRARAKREGRSFYHSMVWAASRCANEMADFRLRMRGDAVVEHDRVDPSFTVLLEDGVYGYCCVPYLVDRDSFLDDAEARLEAMRGHDAPLDDGGRDDLLFVTCLPWVSFSSVSHPIQFPADSIPRLSWGKYREREGRAELPFSVQVNHALMDGEKVGHYFIRLQEIMDEAK